MPLPSFHNVRFPEDISYGSSGGPGFNTTIIELASGAEQRNINWSQQKATYDVSYGVKSREQMEELLEFFYARRGKAYGFRFKDWMDYTMDRQPIGYVKDDGTINLQAFKRYEPQTDYFFDRPITRIVPGTVQLWVNNGFWPPQYLDVDTGIFLTGGAQATTPGALVEASFEFDVPVRFDIDEVKIAHDDWELMSWPSIPLVEIKQRV
jgi:uncharacterized protein (TIGR02217 family)